MTAVYGTCEQRANWSHLRTLTFAIISKECLANFTWTGKSKGEKRNSFKRLKLIHKLLINAINKFDKSYNQKNFNLHMVNNIIKYAYYHRVADKTLSQNNDDDNNNIE